MSLDSMTAGQADDQRRSVDDVSVPSRRPEHSRQLDTVAQYQWGSNESRWWLILEAALRHVKPMEIVMHWLRQTAVELPRTSQNAGEDRSVTPEWPCLMDLLHRSAGGVLLLSLHSWSIHRLRRRLGWRLQSCSWLSRSIISVTVFNVVRRVHSGLYGQVLVFTTQVSRSQDLCTASSVC